MAAIHRFHLDGHDPERPGHKLIDRRAKAFWLVPARMVLGGILLALTCCRVVCSVLVQGLSIGRVVHASTQSRSPAACIAQVRLLGPARRLRVAWPA